MSIRNDYVLHQLRLRDRARKMTSEARRQTVIPKGQEVFDTDLNAMFFGDGETPGGIPLSTLSSETAFVYGVDVDKYTTYNGTDTPVSTTTRTSGSLSTTEKSLVSRGAKGLSGKSRTSTIYFSRTASPAAASTCSRFFVSTPATPDPTIPNPRIAIDTMLVTCAFLYISYPSRVDLMILS